MHRCWFGLPNSRQGDEVALSVQKASARRSNEDRQRSLIYFRADGTHVKSPSILPFVTLIDGFALAPEKVVSVDFMMLTESRILGIRLRLPTSFLVSSYLRRVSWRKSLAISRQMPALLSFSGGA